MIVSRRGSEIQLTGRKKSAKELSESCSFKSSSHIQVPIHREGAQNPVEVPRGALERVTDIGVGSSAVGKAMTCFDSSL